MNFFESNAYQDIDLSRSFFQNWLAFEGLEFPVFTELGTTAFDRSTSDPLESTNYAQCKVSGRATSRSIKSFLDS
jgi:hypothetical protein